MNEPDAIVRGARRETRRPPFALLAGVAVTAGLTWLARPGRRARHSTRGREALITYLRDHLSGSDAALQVVHRLGSTNQEGGPFFRQLAKEFEEERSVVRALLAQMGASGRSVRRTAGAASGLVLGMLAGGEAGDLSLFRTLEGLSVGVQGKRCLWRALQNLRPSPVRERDFSELEAQAVRQWEGIEQRRRALVGRTFAEASG